MDRTRDKNSCQQHELPVSNQGLFLEQFQLSAKRNTIVVQASGTNGTKRIVRTYVIKIGKITGSQ